MYLNKDKNEKDDLPKMTTSGGEAGGVGRGTNDGKGMMNHRNKKYVRNVKPPLYNIKHMNYSFSNKKIGKYDKIKRKLVNTNRVLINTNNVGNNNTIIGNVNVIGMDGNKMNHSVYYNQNMGGRNKEIMPRMNVYKKNYFDHDNINFNTIINSLTAVCSIHIEKTEEEIKKQKEHDENQLIANNSMIDNNGTKSESGKMNLNYEINEESDYPTFVEEIRFTDNMVLLSGILVLPNTDKIFGNLEFEGKTNPIPPECNLSVYVNVVNKYNCQYYKKLMPASYNFKNRLFFAMMNNNGTIDSSLWIDKFIVKGNFQAVSIVVLGQSEEMSENLRSYNENLYDRNMKTTLEETMLDVENIDTEKDERFAPKQQVEIKTCNISSIVMAPFKWHKLKTNKGNVPYKHSLKKKYQKINELANILEQEFLEKNGMKGIFSYQKEEEKKEQNGEISFKEKYIDTKKGIGSDKNEQLKKKEKGKECTEHGKVKLEVNEGKEHGNRNEMETDKKRNRKDLDFKEKRKAETETKENTYASEKLDKIEGKQKIIYFEPPREDLILKILNTLTKIYKRRKELYLENISAYEKILKYGGLWIFYIYKELKNDEENFYLNSSKYVQIKISDILGALLILRRCALYSNLAECLIHMNFDTSQFCYDEKKPHILIYLLDLLRFDHIYFLASWKVKSAITKTLVALTSNAYVMNLFCNCVS